MDALQVWGALLPFNWAVKPAHTALPYFCTVLKDGSNGIKVRFLMLEGWQTMHDFVRVRMDANFGFRSAPMEFPHFELVVPESGTPMLFRHDPGYFPAPAEGAQRELAAKILWESYGVFLRVEADPGLPMKFADERAIFARVEGADGTWRDEPLAIPDPRPHVEKVVFDKGDVKRAQDLPFDKDAAVEVDFRLLPGETTAEKPRPRCVYQLIALDSDGRKLVDMKMAMAPEGGLRALWESMPPRLLKSFVALGRIPGEVKVKSGRVFRFLRPLCMELPLKLSLHDSMPNLDIRNAAPA